MVWCGQSCHVSSSRHTTLSTWTGRHATSSRDSQQHSTFNHSSQVRSPCSLNDCECENIRNINLSSLRSAIVKRHTFSQNLANQRKMTPARKLEGRPTPHCEVHPFIKLNRWFICMAATGCRSLADQLGYWSTHSPKGHWSDKKAMLSQGNRAMPL